MLSRRLGCQLFNIFRFENYKISSYQVMPKNFGGIASTISGQHTSSKGKNLNLLQTITSRMSTCIKPQSILADKGGQFIPRQTICRSFSNCFQNNDLLQPDGFWNFTSIRTKIRCHFPRPCEDKRIKRHGFKKRMSTPAGRRIIMNRILKGRHVLTH